VKIDLETTPNAHLYRVVDLDSGKYLQLVTAANDETGEYTIVLTDEHGRVKIGADERIQKEDRKGNIKITMIDEGILKW
jgi:hypothetical protein